MSRSERPAKAAPTAEEMAAIIAAVDAAWPRPVVVASADAPSPTTAWRWSGRWWGPRQVAAARRRPWG